MPVISPSRHQNLQLQKRIEEENHLIIKKLLEIENKPFNVKKFSKANTSHTSDLSGTKFKNFKSLNYVTRKNDYNRIKNENMRIISKIQNVKSAINSLNLRDHMRRHNKLKKLIGKNTSISQMIENSRYKIAYSSYCPTPGFLSTKNTPRFKRIADQMLKEEGEHMIAEKMKNWKRSVFHPAHRRAGSVPKYKDLQPIPQDKDEGNLRVDMVLRNEFKC